MVNTWVIMVGTDESCFDNGWSSLISVDRGWYLQTWVDDPAVSHDRSRHLGAPVLTCNSSAQQIRPQYVPVSCKRTEARHLGLRPFFCVKTWVAPGYTTYALFLSLQHIRLVCFMDARTTISATSGLITPKTEAGYIWKPWCFWRNNHLQ